MLIRKCFFLLFTFLLTLNLHAQLLTEKEIRKLHPQFKAIISEEIPKINIKSTAPQLNLLRQLNNNSNKYGAIIYTVIPDALKSIGIKPNSILNNFVTARVSAADLINISRLESVKFITPGYTENLHNDIASGLVGADLLQEGYVNSTPFNGTNVVVCIIDTGIDWAHSDFRDPNDPTKSRIIFIWDQTLTATGSEVPPPGFDYGVEYTKAEIENEIDGSPAGFVREEDTNGHGTHVAGTAAGNGSSLTPAKYIGIAHVADILVIKAGNGSFQTSNLIDALTYAKQKSVLLGKPIVVNMSLGSDFGPHDGSDSKSAAINDFTGSGRVVVESAGNSGDSYIHLSGTLASGGTAIITLTVSAYTPQSGSSNDNFGVDTWFENDGNVSVEVTTPNGFSQSRTAGGDVTTSNDDGSIYLYNDINAGNSDREIETYFYDAVSTKTPAAGTWTIIFTNNSGSMITFHSWLYDSSIGTNGSVSLNGGNTDFTLGNTASNALIVGSYVSRWRWFSIDGSGHYYTGTDYSDDISSFSSKGPTRNGLQKPDINAPGQAVISSKSASSNPSTSSIVPGNLHLKNQGTSMSSPIVTGCAALLLQQNPNLSASEIKSLITSTSIIDSYTGGSLPDNTWGYGKINIYKAMIKLIDPGFENDWKLFSYDSWGSEGYLSVEPNEKIAVRFSPTFDGKITGVFFYPSTTVGLSGPLYAEIWSNNAGFPGTKLGSTVSFDENKILKYSWNYIDLTGTGVSVYTGNDYHIVIYFTSGTTTNFRYENVSSDDRSLINSGSGWSTYANDLRIRPVMTKDISALPVELSTFTATAENENITLSWVTITEINNYGFEIERKESKNKKSEADTWQKIFFVSGCGTSDIPHKYSFIDKYVINNSTFYYRLKIIDFNGKFEFSPEIEVNFYKPAKFILAQNYPNPFNPSTIINFELASKCNVSIKIYDVPGNEVQTLLNEEKPAGKYSVEFNGTKLASGIYFYKISTPDFVDIKKMILLK